MRKTLALGFTFLVVLAVCFLPAQNVSTLYGSWKMTSQNAVTATSGQKMSVQPCYVGVGTPAGGNRQIFPLATNVPVTIVDGSNGETVTPSAVSAPAAASTGSPTPFACSLTATFTKAHKKGVQIISGDAGAQEAVNDSSAAAAFPVGVVAGNNTWTGNNTFSQKIISTKATGTAPFQVASTTNVANLNASSLNGATFAAPGPIGGTTADAGTFTSVTITTGTAPTCAVGVRGQFSYTAGGTGVKDIVQVCAKGADDSYSWRAIY